MSADLARLEVRAEGKVVVGAVSGEVDMSNASSLVGALLAHVTNEDDGLVLDLDELRYLDSAGIRSVFDLRERLAHRGQRLCLVLGEGSIAGDALEVAGIGEAVPVARTVEQALDRVSSDADTDEN